MTITCFWLEETGRASIALRRYDPHMQHEAQTFVDIDFPMQWNDEGHAMLASDHCIADDDPRWPTHCTRGGSCVRPFDASDVRHIMITPRYRRSDTSEIVALENAPVGAMWRERWHEPWADLGSGWWRRGPDGICLAVRTPGGDWSIDHKSRNGGYWNRSGTPPLITATPSILMPRYHGWLRDGQLVDA